MDWDRLEGKLAPGRTDAEARGTAESLVGVALALAFSRAAFSIEAVPGWESRSSVLEIGSIYSPFASGLRRGSRRP